MQIRYLLYLSSTKEDRLQKKNMGPGYGMIALGIMAAVGSLTSPLLLM